MRTPRRAFGHSPLAGALAVALAVGAGWGAAPATGEEQRFSERIAVTEVEVPVRVLVKGRPVAGLTREDFVLLDRGERQEILGFSVRTLTAGGGEGLGADRSARSRPTASPAPGRGRRLIVLFDLSSARLGRMTRALEDLRESLATLVGPDDRVAVGVYGGNSGLTLLVGFTDDRARIGRALEVVDAILDADASRQRDLLGRLHHERFAAEGSRGSTFGALERELGSVAALTVLGGDVVYDEAEDAGVDVERQESFFAPVRVRVDVDRTEPFSFLQEGLDGVSGVRAFALALTELAYLLRGVPGQREVLMISEGFGGPLLRDSRALFYLEKAIKAFRDGGWLVHAIDAKGLGTIDESNFTADSLLFLTDATGGELVENTNDFTRGVSRVLERTSVVYLLSFQPTEPGEEGEFRKLDVRLAERMRGAKISHRPGYYGAQPPARREVFERKVDGAGWLLSNLEAAELAVELRAEVARDPLGGVRVPFAVEVAGGSLLDAQSRKPTRLELEMIARDESGLTDLVTAETLVDRRSAKSRLEAGGVRFTGDLGLLPGDYRLRLLVRSQREGTVFLATYDLTIPAEGAAVAGLAPIVERSEVHWITVPAENRSAYFR